MKLLNTKAIAALVITSAMSVGTTSAMGLPSGTSPLISVIGINSGKIKVNMKDGVATLFGHAESAIERAVAARYVAKQEGVNKVINLIFIN